MFPERHQTNSKTRLMTHIRTIGLHIFLVLMLVIAPRTFAETGRGDPARDLAKPDGETPSVGRAPEMSKRALAMDQPARRDLKEMERVRNARDAIKALGKRLRAMDRYSVNAELRLEQVLKSGEKIITHEDVWADVAPNRLRMTVLSPGRERTIFFDGNKVTIWSPLNRYYAADEFNGDLADLPVFLAKEHAVDVPLADLLLWGREPVDLKATTQANYVGRERVDHRLCDHYAIRQKDVDWQIWIDSGGAGLPCKYAIIDVNGKGSPVWQATFQFDAGSTFADGRFSFVPPKDAVEIAFGSAETHSKQGR